MLEIPDETVRALGLPWEEARMELQREFAVALYSRGVLSAGKASEMFGMPRLDFERLLCERQTVRSYSMDDLQHDLEWAEAQK